MGRIVILFLSLAMMVRAQHVIVFGIDGLSVGAFNRARIPRLHQMMRDAAWTLEARGVMPTLSSPNWASMMDGAGPEQHGITSNGYLKPMQELQPVCRDEDGIFPTIFHLLRAARPTANLAVFHDWPGFANLVEKSAPDVMRHEHGPQKTVEAAIAYWREKRPELLFVQIDNVDHAGHASGWLSRDYLREVEEADRLLGTVLDMVRDDPAADSTYVLVSSDHGGKGRNHGKNSLEEIRIPWILAGPDVAARPLATSVYTFDTAATIAWILHVSPDACWIGRPVEAAFQPSAITLRTAAGGQCTDRGITAPAGVPTLAGPAAPHGEHHN